MKSEAKDSGNIRIMTFLCIFHQENFYKMSLSTFNHMATVVSKNVDFIRSKELNHRQFEQFLNEMENKKADIIYYIEVR